ncbi:hypothetical protein B0H11DRAFT_1939938 [Mycena galericulata]|nr:hypothetical protein B0H11DRAFT_1939938 [Mycena galericulata]
MPFPFDPPPDARKMSKEEIGAYNARVASWIYNDKLRAAEAARPAEEREARREARLASSRKYRERLRTRREKRREQKKAGAIVSERLEVPMEERREHEAGGETPCTSSSCTSSSAQSDTPPTHTEESGESFPESLEIERARNFMWKIEAKIRRAQDKIRFYAGFNPSPSRTMGQGQPLSLEEFKDSDLRQERMWADRFRSGIDIPLTLANTVAEDQQARPGAWGGSEEVD